MEGFQDGVPVQASVTFAEGAFPLSNAQRRTDGLLAETESNGVITRWFVPWTSVNYINQELPAQNVPTQPQVIQPTPPVGGGEEPPSVG